MKNFFKIALAISVFLVFLMNSMSVSANKTPVWYGNFDSFISEMNGYLGSSYKLCDKKITNNNSDFKCEMHFGKFAYIEYYDGVEKRVPPTITFFSEDRGNSIYKIEIFTINGSDETLGSVELVRIPLEAIGLSKKSSKYLACQKNGGKVWFPEKGQYIIVKKKQDKRYHVFITITAEYS